MRFTGWVRMSEPGDKTGARWRHVRSGWEVRHCGHPTANWPYYAVDPEHQECTTVTHNGLGFQSLTAAIGAVEHVLAGLWVVTGDNCTPGTRRVLPKREAIR